MEKPLEVCILAAGLGKRMKSDTPKFLHEIAGRPMLAHLLDSVAELAPARVHLVVGHGADAVKAAFGDRDINFVHQHRQLGTGHAVMQALPDVSPDSRLLMLLGDAPLITAATLGRLVASETPLAVLSVVLDNPFGYGRIVRDGAGHVVAIIEQRDANPEEQAICEINTGGMVADASLLATWLGRLGQDNDQGEYLLTDIVGEAARDGLPVAAVMADAPGEVQGINTQAQLAMCEREYQRRAAKRLMDDGVHILDPARFDLRGSLDCGPGCRIDVSCVFEGASRLGANVRVEPNCIIRDSEIGDGVVVGAGSVVEGARVGAGNAIGPLAHLPAGTVVPVPDGDDNRHKTRKPS